MKLVEGRIRCALGLVETNRGGIISKRHLMTSGTEFAYEAGSRGSLKLTVPPPPLAGSVILDYLACHAP